MQGVGSAHVLLGATEGLALVDQLRGVEGLLVDAGGQLHTSRTLTTLFAEEDAIP